MMSKYPLLGMTLIELQSLVKRLGMPGFAAKQIASWLYDKKVTSIDEMTNLSLKYRELLKQNYEVGAEAPVEEMRSVDGTVKYLYPVGENHFVESVYIPDDERATLCISSQVGCKMNCKFCMTGKQGYSANLTAHQITYGLDRMVMHGVRSGLPFQLSDCGKDCGALSKKATVILPSACILR